MEFPGAPTFNTIDYFLIVFLLSVVALPLSYVTRARWFHRVLHIALGSLALYSVAPRLLLAYLAFWLVVYLFTWLVRISIEGILGTLKLLLPVVAMLLPMVLWKTNTLWFEGVLNLDLHWLLWMSWRPLGEVDAIYYLVAPLGLSFAVFRAIDLVVAVHVGTVERPRLIDILAYGLFAPVQIVGPIIQFREIDRDPVEDRVGLSRWGLSRIVIGLAKAFVLAWPLGWSAGVFGIFEAQTVPVLWLSILVFPVYMYLNFSGFSDISIGISALYGYRLDPNFNNPLMRTTLQQFWNNWHMSLTRFAQRNIFVPLGGYRRQTQYLALICTMMTIALWHDLSIALAIFGLLHGFGLIAERMMTGARTPARGAKPAPTSPARSVGAWAVVYAFITLTFPLLILEDVHVAGFYAALVGVRF